MLDVLLVLHDLQQLTPAEDEVLLPQHHLDLHQDRRRLGDNVEMADTLLHLPDHRYHLRRE